MAGQNFIMAKRKREENSSTIKPSVAGENDASKIVKTNGHVDVKTTSLVIQIVAGSYERVLHGITASITNTSLSDPALQAKFADTFLFNAHASSVRCLALSPLPDQKSPEAQAVYLASGGSDEKVNVYSLSASPVLDNGQYPSMPSLGSNTISENPRNRELGTLLQHSSNITALHFPTRSKLLAGSDDNTISITRLRDLAVVSTIKAPHPKVQGQPSGDTAPPGATPSGINDFSVHPSLKLMLSVGRGERCMRLWNLVTGKKAGVLNFSRNVLQSVRESKHSSGEGRKISWSPDGGEFAVSFQRGAVVFGEDSKAKCKILPHPLTKLHQIRYLSVADTSGNETTLLAVSTEDGRVLFYNPGKVSVDATNGPSTNEGSLPDATLHAQMGGRSTGILTRIKDFEILHLPATASEDKSVVIVTASSDGSIKLFHLAALELLTPVTNVESKWLGTVIGTYSTGNRITCMRAFVMLPPQDLEDDLGDDDADFQGFASSSDEGDSEGDSEGDDN